MIVRESKTLPFLAWQSCLFDVRWFGVGRQLRALLLSPFVRQRLRSLFSMERPQEDLQFLKELIEAEKVAPLIDRTYPLSEATEAIR